MPRSWHPAPGPVARSLEDHMDQDPLGMGTYDLACPSPFWCPWLGPLLRWAAPRDAERQLEPHPQPQLTVGPATLETCAVRLLAQPIREPDGQTVGKGHLQLSLPFKDPRPIPRPAGGHLNSSGQRAARARAAHLDRGSPATGLLGPHGGVCKSRQSMAVTAPVFLLADAPSCDITGSTSRP